MNPYNLPQKNFTTTKSDFVRIINPHFNLQQICRSGQCFRLKDDGGGNFCVIAHGKVLRLRHLDDGAIFYCSKEDYRFIWHDYFDLNTDYAAYISAIGDADPVLKAAVTFGSGIRILRQNLWEMIITFIISQQSNILRITKNIAAISERFGAHIADEATCFYDFPTPAALFHAGTSKLQECGLGYRSDYIYHTSKAIFESEIDLESIKTMTYQDAKKTLLYLKGVGDKVADCICLFGLYHLDAFPKDTHMNRILQRDYPKGFDYNAYVGYNGLVQQYLFYYELWNKKNKTE